MVGCALSHNRISARYCRGRAPVDSASSVPPHENRRAAPPAPIRQKCHSSFSVSLTLLIDLHADAVQLIWQFLDARTLARARRPYGRSDARARTGEVCVATHQTDIDIGYNSNHSRTDTAKFNLDCFGSSNTILLAVTVYRVAR